MGDLYSLADLQGKTAFAKVKTPLFRGGETYDNGKPVFEVGAGQAIGVIDGWLSPKAGRSYYYLMFYDAKKVPYYAKVDNKIDSSKFQDQGVKTTQQQEAAKVTPAEKRANTAKKAGKLLETAGWGFLGLMLYRYYKKPYKTQKA